MRTNRNVINDWLHVA